MIDFFDFVAVRESRFVQVLASVNSARCTQPGSSQVHAVPAFKVTLDEFV